MYACPECNGAARVIESRLDQIGRRRRRWRCESCKQRWTTHGDELPPRVRVRGLGEDAIFDILTSSESSAVLKRRWNCSQQTINRTRTGELNANVLPELRRWPGRRSCKACRHWQRGCTLGIKAPSERGTRYARECLRFEGQPVPVKGDPLASQALES
jgi:predicted Zn finger-like uncharacterized protein